MNNLYVKCGLVITRIYYKSINGSHTSSRLNQSICTFIVTAVQICMFILNRLLYQYNELPRLEVEAKGEISSHIFFPP